MAFRGDKCKGCGKIFTSPEDMTDVIGWFWEHGRIGHTECLNKYLQNNKPPCQQTTNNS